MQHQPELDQLGDPHANIAIWVQSIRSLPSSKSWCSYVGKILKRQHAYHMDEICSKVHAVLVSEDIVMQNDAVLATVVPPAEAERT
eukprot:10649363-Karenia_brevis.AAC.1